MPWVSIIGLVTIVTFIIVTAIMNGRPLAIAALVVGLMTAPLSAHPMDRILHDARQQFVPKVRS